PQSFDLVITDQTMPMFTGVELSRKILAIRPDIPVIICTGYTAAVTEHQAKAIGVRAFFPKPLVMGQIARLIRDVLDEKR
ncbi:MAG: response regulator, partial [Pseudomonadota bacterium]